MTRWNSGLPQERVRLLALVALCTAGISFAASDGYVKPSFETYRPILDRMPFGALPANFNVTPVDPATAKTEEQVKADQQKLARQINMSAVNVTPGGETAIGFTDLSEKTPINYYLLVGGEGGGWKVISADYDEEIATVEKDGISITLKLGKGLIDTPAQPPAASTVRALPPGIHRENGLPPTSLRTSPQAHSPGMPRGIAGMPPLPEQNADRTPSSYTARLLERKMQEAKKTQAEAKVQQEQMIQLAREAAKKEIAKREEEAAQVQPQEPANGDANQETQPQQPPEGAPPEPAQ